MRPLGTWLGRLAIAGTCLAMVGCGGGDVPDPDSDANAAADQPAQVVAQAAPESSAPAPEPSPPAATEPPVPVAEAMPRAEPDPASQAVAAAPALKADSSATDELARLAAAPPEAAPAATQTPVGAEGNPAAMRGPEAPGSENAATGESANAAGVNERGPAVAGGPESGMGVPGAPGGEAIAGGSEGGSGGVGAQEPADFRQPSTAAVAFLSALKAKDKDRLAQATARRAQTEAAAKHQKLFAAISEGSISDEELDDLSRALDGFVPIRQIPAISTGRIGIVVGKTAGRDYLQRTLTIRKEKEGWKVLDISNMLDFGSSNRGGRRR